MGDPEQLPVQGPLLDPTRLACVQWSGSIGLPRSSSPNLPNFSRASCGQEAVRPGTSQPMAVNGLLHIPRCRHVHVHLTHLGLFFRLKSRQTPSKPGVRFVVYDRCRFASCRIVRHQRPFLWDLTGQESGDWIKIFARSDSGRGCRCVAGETLAQS